VQSTRSCPQGGHSHTELSLQGCDKYSAEEFIRHPGNPEEAESMVPKSGAMATEGTAEGVTFCRTVQTE
jgi:hypothetical protein